MLLSIDSVVGLRYIFPIILLTSFCLPSNTMTVPARVALPHLSGVGAPRANAKSNPDATFLPIFRYYSTITLVANTFSDSLYIKPKIIILYKLS